MGKEWQSNKEAKKTTSTDTEGKKQLNGKRNMHQHLPFDAEVIRKS